MPRALIIITPMEKSRVKQAPVPVRNQHPSIPCKMFIIASSPKSSFVWSFRREEVRFNAQAGEREVTI